MGRGTLAGVALTVGGIIVGAVLLIGDPPARKADPCVQITPLADARARDVETTMQAVRDNPAPPTGGRYANRFDFGAHESAQQNARHAIARYAAVVEQNPACFDAETRADADALARTWNVD